MNVMEIVLLAAGGIVFILSFLLPAGREESSEENKAVAREEMKKLVSQEMDGIRSHVDDLVEETVGYAMEKTERALERLSNEKIMAVSQYSDTVLQEINKNHQEVMFLYDMLNAKHDNLKNTVSEVHKTVKEAEETKKEAQAVMNSFQKLTPDKVSVSGDKVLAQDFGSGKNLKSPNAEKEEEVRSAVSQGGVGISFIKEADGQGRNCNDRILELYKEGKSKVAIAQELGLGVGEVKLVIDLYKNI